jgi:hypothetical protein
MGKIEELGELRASLIGYMKVKIGASDWHAVADAAMDLREIEAKIEVYSEQALDKYRDASNLMAP